MVLILEVLEISEDIVHLKEIMEVLQHLLAEAEAELLQLVQIILAAHQGQLEDQELLTL